jgi:hypothetical protein
MTSPRPSASPDPENQPPQSTSAKPDGAHGSDRTADPRGSDDDSPMRSRGPANEQAGSGVEGLGGAGGGTPDAGGLGQPGGAQPLATGPAHPQNTPTAGTTSAGGLNATAIPDNAVADSHQHPADAPLTFGDPSPYLAANAPGARHLDGSLSVAGGSAGSAVGSADDLEVTPTAAPDDDHDAPSR